MHAALVCHARYAMALAFIVTAGTLLLAGAGCWLFQRSAAARRNAKAHAHLDSGGPGGSRTPPQHLYASGPTRMPPQPRPTAPTAQQKLPGVAADSASSIELGRNDSRGADHPAGAPHSSLLHLNHQHSGPGV
jgi:hypothetical protein